uniref:Uncharacterized protein n=1 Tax=Anguilla anguilla TaxID=7936 RepID=A0A0E9WXN7_ANGAN
MLHCSTYHFFYPFNGNIHCLSHENKSCGNSITGSCSFLRTLFHLKQKCGLNFSCQMSGRYFSQIFYYIHGFVFLCMILLLTVSYDLIKMPCDPLLQYFNLRCENFISRTLS